MDCVSWERQVPVHEIHHAAAKERRCLVTFVPVNWAGPGVSPAKFSTVLSAAMNSSDVLPLQSFSRHVLSLACVGEKNSIMNAQSSVPRRVVDPQDEVRIAQDDASQALSLANMASKTDDMATVGLPKESHET